MRPLMLMFLVGCAVNKSDEVGTFSASGEDNLDLGNFDEGDDNDDDGNGDESEDGEGDGDGFSPTITDATAFFNADPVLGDVIELHLMYEDPQDDVEGGVLEIDYSSDVENSSLSVDIDGVQALLEEGEVYVLFQGVNTEVAYTFNVVMYDVEGNFSTEVTAEALPTDD